MAFSKIIFNGTTLMDVTQDTVAAGNLLQGETATGADGEQVTGAYVPSGGGVVEPESGVIFIDYDGTLVDAWETVDVAGKTALPSNPTHTDMGLTSQGWNWSLADIKSYIQNYPNAIMTVGQMYVTTSGATEIDIKLLNGALHPYLGIGVNGTVSVDWGDNSTPSTMTGSSLTTLIWSDHTYSAAGDYTISITVMSGSFNFAESGSAYTSVLSYTNSSTASQTYPSTILAIRLGNNVTVSSTRALTGLINLLYITIPSGITSFGGDFLNRAYSLRSLILPNTVTSIGANAFNGDYVLEFVSFPNSVTTMGNAVISAASGIKHVAFPTGLTTLPQNTCNVMRSLRKVTIPEGVTTLSSQVFYSCTALYDIYFPSTVRSIGSSCFYGCCSLHTFTIPNGMTGALNSSVFYNCYALQTIDIPSGITSIGSSAFYNCTSLLSITIPDTITSIGTNAFYGCVGLNKIRFERTTPPTVSASNAWTNLPTFCIVFVPVGSLSNYLAASNYPAKATYTYMGYGTYALGASLPSQDSTQAYNLTWYANVEDAKAQTNPITQGNGNEVYCRYVAV